MVRFSLKSFFMEKNFAFYDFGGEQIAEANPIIRGQNDLSKSILEDTSLTFGAAVNADVERTSIKHVLFLIGPTENGVYPHPDTYASLQKTLLWSKLTMRTANAVRDKNYSIEQERNTIYIAKSKFIVYLRNTRVEEPAQIKAYVIFSRISPRIYRIVNDTKGEIRYVNVGVRTEALNWCCRHCSSTEEVMS